jgi:hypothetical protein
MPGYLSNRYITFNPAADNATVTASLATTNTNVTNLTTRVTEAEANIDDLSLNLGV